MSQLNRLLESANPYKSLQSDAARLASKWKKTGLLENISDETGRNNMAMILENQAKQLVIEASNNGGGVGAAGFTTGTGAQWAGVALPLVRKVFGQIAAKEFVSVQPMNMPSGLVFYLDFQYGTTKSPFKSGESLYGNTEENGPFGNTNKGGLYGVGRFGYSINNTSSATTLAATRSANFYSDFNADSNYKDTGSYSVYAVATSSLGANWDKQAIRGFYLTSSTMNSDDILPAFTKINGGNIEFVAAAGKGTATGSTTIVYHLQPTDGNRGDFEDGNTHLNANNNPISIPELNVDMKSEGIIAKTRKLKAVWTPEFSQDLQAYQTLDAEAEVTSIMSEYISLEIDMEILDMLIDAASAGTEYWTAENNTAIDGNGVISNALAYYNSQGQWFQTLGTKVQKLSNIIHQKTMRGGANFMVVSPAVATILESIPGFASSSDGDVTRNSYAFGVQKAGSIQSKITVWKNPYMNENTVLMGFRGNQFLEAGAVFAPYVPLIMTPLVYDPDTFTPRKGLLTRYAKKVLRPEFFGKIYVGGLDTI